MKSCAETLADSAATETKINEINETLTPILTVLQDRISE